MSWPIPQYSRKQVARAGQILAENTDFTSSVEALEDWIQAYAVLANWRACHGYPINTFQATLRQRLKKVDQDALVAQRLKRTPSILNKLQRFKGMNLARMQDIGGLRAVVSSVKQLNLLHKMYKSLPLTHELVSEYNYLESPKQSGYRSIHLVYRYKSRAPSPYDGLQLEIQLRTRLQHSWATAVETMGTFLKHPLKSSEGPEEWLKFFALAGNAFTYLEGTPQIPGFEQYSPNEIYQQVEQEANRLRIRAMLLGYSSAVKEIAPSTRTSAFYLVQLNVDDQEKTVSITPFAKDQLEKANTEYAEAEKSASKTGNQVVLVSAGSIESLKRAYPNYFLDTHEFLSNLGLVEQAAAKLRENG